MFLRLPPAGGNPRQISEVVNNILDGKINSTGSLSVDTTLAPITVQDARVGADSVILLMPMNADATTLNSHIYFSSVTNGQFVISLRTGHGSTVGNFRYVVLG
jgi:hypothetical protein